MTEQPTDLLCYKNPKIIEHFYKKNPDYGHDHCQQLFSDLMAWFHLKAIRKCSDKKTYLFGPLLVLDELWHCFILHTREYIKFSVHFFGEYLHHEVEPIGKEHYLTPEETADFLQDGFLHLGEDWVMRYFGFMLKMPDAD